MLTLGGGRGFVVLRYFPPSPDTRHQAIDVLQAFSPLIQASMCIGIVRTIQPHRPAPSSLRRAWNG